MTPSKMSADKRYTVIIEDARLYRVAPCKANQIFVKVSLEGSKKGKETKAATHDGDKFVFINESAEIEVDSCCTSPTVVVIKVMQTGMLKSSRVGKLRIQLPDTLPFERTPVMPNELKDRQGQVVGTIGVYLMLKSITGNYMAIQRKKIEHAATQETEPAGIGAKMLSCTTFFSTDSSSVYSAPTGPGSDTSSRSSSRASHVLMCGQHPQSLMREGTLQGRSLPPLKSNRRPSMADSDAARMNIAMPFNRNITQHSNETVSSMQSRGSAQSRASISRLSTTTSTDDYPLSPAANPPMYLAQGGLDDDHQSGNSLVGSQSLPANITAIPVDRFPHINNLPDELDAVPRFPDMN